MSTTTKSSTPRYGTVNVPVDTLARIDHAREVLAERSGVLSRAALLTAAVEHYLESLADEGYDVDSVPTDQFTDLAGTRIPYRPVAHWAIVDTSVTPNTVSLVTGHGPGRLAVLTETARILPHLVGRRYGSWKEMLNAAGYHIDTSRTLDDRDAELDDGRTLVPVTT